MEGNIGKGNEGERRGEEPKVVGIKPQLEVEVKMELEALMVIKTQA